MAIPVFFVENPDKSDVLSADDSFHANKVLRLKSGDAIYILDGAGKKFKATLLVSDARKSTYSNIILEIEEKTNKNLLNLWIAPTKQMERMEWMVEKCTEMGIRSIGFFQSKNSERKEIKIQRLEKIVISAMKQSKQLFKPQLNPIISFDDLLKKLEKSFELKGFAYISENNNLTIRSFANMKQESIALIGPEGDFTPNEIIKLNSHGFKGFSLGNSILRTETAGILTCASFNLSN
ncbi:MAG: rRNA ((1498)-N(3))-methyltransferase [Bacteroidota bacterium]|jgi:16S rRNA (uracil1498-N3)-methyltransferase